MDKKQSEDGWRRFLHLCHQAKSEDELATLFGLFLTLEERDDLSGRFRIVEELLKGQKNQRDMAKELGVSISKITRGSNSLKVISPELRAFLEERML
ncbi:MAG: trp operon repressor [Sphingomonadales bacterium]|nr:trp operon repressor [Sphingomonadales bacterium]